MSIQPPATEVAVARLREDVSEVHADLLAEGRITAGAGSVSGRVPESELFVLTPSGPAAETLGPADTVVCDLAGSVVPDSVGSRLAPAADTGLHARLYSEHPEVGGIVHAADGTLATGADVRAAAVAPPAPQDPTTDPSPHP